MPVNREAITVDLDRIRGLNRAQLAYEAGCGEPSHESEGARLLSSVRDGLVYLIESELDSDDYLERACDSGDAGELDYGGALHEIADGAPSVYTWTTWQEFTDLQAWQEDPTDLGFEGENMEKGANICLYMIADRLVRTLAESVVEAGATEPDDGWPEDPDDEADEVVG